jgi:hypothetical protein
MEGRKQTTDDRRRRRTRLREGQPTEYAGGRPNKADHSNMMLNRG